MQFIAVGCALGLHGRQGIGEKGFYWVQAGIWTCKQLCGPEMKYRGVPKGIWQAKDLGKSLPGCPRCWQARSRRTP